MLRESKNLVLWVRVIWFFYVISKFVFMAWVSIRDRMLTLDKMVIWSRGFDIVCVLCKNVSESRSYLFFQCEYSF